MEWEGSIGSSFVCNSKSFPKSFWWLMETGHDTRNTNVGANICKKYSLSWVASAAELQKNHYPDLIPR